MSQFREHYQDPKINKWDIFHYVYGVLHQPEYHDPECIDRLVGQVVRVSVETVKIVEPLPTGLGVG